MGGDLRLRSIPPRTMASLAAQRPPAMLPWSVAPLQQRLLVLGENLAHVARGADSGPAVPAWARPGRALSRRPYRAGGRLGAPDAGPAGPSDRHGRFYQRPGRGSTAGSDLLVPPRSGPDGAQVAHAVGETAEAQIVSIVFPVAVEPEEVRWELHGDVLEVEYVGTAYKYFHAFLVPSGTEPEVQRVGRTVSFRFPKSR